MKVLITGITGMVGTHWAQYALKKGWSVYGIDMTKSAKPALKEVEQNIFCCDILDNQALQGILEKVKPELLIHLAAQSFNSLSWEMEELTHNTNYLGTLKILQTMRKICPDARTLLASTSVVYGMVKPEDCPLKEDRPLRPVTPYAVSKAANEHLGYQYYQNFNLKIFLPRFFGMLGPGHPPNTAIQSFARQLALIARKKQKPVIKVGNLETARDYIDVRDGISAMMTVLDKGLPGRPVNICSGKGIKIYEILNMLIEISELTVTIEQDSSKLRPSDEPLLYGDNSRLRKLGWEPTYSIHQALEMIFKDWLERI